MSELPLLDYIEQESARLRAEVGGDRAAEKAERLEFGWRDTALEIVRDYARSHERFLAEHINVSVPEGATRKAMGAVMRNAARRGWIQTDGWAPACTSNGSAKRVWRSLIFGGAA